MVNIFLLSLSSFQSPHRFLNEFKIKSFAMFDFLVLHYETCFLSSRKTCKGGFEIEPRKKNADLSSCINHCNEDKSCKFIFLVSSTSDTNANTCMKFSSCDEHRTATNLGTTYSKLGNCPSKLYS